MRQRKRRRRQARLLRAQMAGHRQIEVPRRLLRHCGWRPWTRTGNPPEGARFVHGRWHVWSDKQGPVAASYSADMIGTGRLRRPVKIGGERFVYMGGTAEDFRIGVQVFRLVPRAEWMGECWTHGEKLALGRPEGDLTTLIGSGWSSGEYGRNDPNGFYHGVKARVGKAEMVLVGPPIYLVPMPKDKEPRQRRQLSLF
jgi:hypothetical protein